MATPLQQEESLVWGVLSFAGPPLDAEVAFDIDAMADGTHFGNPGPIIETVQSLLIDGALASVTGWENREIPIRLRLSANDGEALAEAEAALFQQVLMDQPPPLVWTGPVGLSAPAVFDVVVARLERDTSEGWDLEEKMRGYRYFLLTLACLPFARPVESMVVPALPVPVDPETPVWVDVNDCTSTTDWTLETNGDSPTGPTLSGGVSVRAAAIITSAGKYLRLVLTDTFAVPADHYLAVDVVGAQSGGGANGWKSGDWKTRINGIYRDPIAITYDGELGSHRLFFDDLPVSVTELAILKDFAGPNPGDSTTTLTPLVVYNVAYTDTLGGSSTTTNRQQSRLVTVTGSAPTQAAVTLYDANADPLGGDILIYTSRNTDWRPNLRRWVTDSEAPTGDAARVSGARHSLATPTTITIPADQIHAGSYALMAFVDLNFPETLTWQARMVTSGGAATVGSSVVVEGEIGLEATDGFELVNLAALVLPIVEVESDDYAIEITLTGTIGIEIDEGLLFSLDDGALTWVKDTEDLDWVEVRSPELGAARPSVWGGKGGVGEGASCIDWKCLSFGSHRFDPGVMQIFTLTTTSLESQCEMEYFPRFGWNPWAPETT